MTGGSRRDASASGRVTLVGAGPGDAELLTLKAVRALQAADVILFDDLVSDEVLELARREAKRMLVGKRGGRTSCRQEDINAHDGQARQGRQTRRAAEIRRSDDLRPRRRGDRLSAGAKAFQSISCPASPPPAPWPRGSASR